MVSKKTKSLFWSRVEKVERLAPDVVSVWVVARKVAEKIRPGQFIGVKVPERDDLVLRRPFSVADVSGKLLRVVFKVVGPGTEKLARSQKGDSWDIIGPLGKEAPLVQNRDVVVCAGGVGAAPLFYLTRTLLRMRNKVTVVLGARRRSDLILNSEFRELVGKVLVSTEDGGRGFKGQVTSLLERVVTNIEKPVVYACGPESMLKALSRLSEKVLIWAFLEGRIGCGFGVCYGCAVEKRGGGYLRLCKDGPVLRLDEVVL
ncbi:MAG: dihydroorotate dehydrogenase electron transfer subunit [bacterium]